MRGKIYVAAAGAISLLVGVPAMAAKKIEPTGLELQQIQSRDFEAGKDIVFSSVMSILQDAGYRIGSADKDTGLITGTASTSGKLTYNIWFGIGSKKETPIVSAYIEPWGPAGGTRVRFNFVLTKGKSRNAFSDETPITDPTVYRTAFEKVEQAIFVRQAMMPSAPKNALPTAAAATAAVLQ